MSAPSFIELVKGAAADLANAAANAVRIFVDDGTGEPSYKDEAGTVTSLVGAAGTPGADGADGADAPPLTYLDHGNTGSTETVDASADDYQRLVLNAATVTLTLTGWPAAGTPGLVRIWLEQDVTGGRDVVWPGSVDWGDPGEPTWTDTTGGAVLLVDLTTVDGGMRVEAIVAGRAGPAGAAGTNGTNGTNGVDGSVGGAISIDYTFSTTTTDSDPGSGNLRLSNATQASAVTLRADLLDAHGVDWTAVLDTLADASNTVKGHIRLFKKSDPTKWLLMTVSAVATPSGYRNVTIANVGSSGANPLSNGDAICLAFSRSGDQGSTVGAGTLTTIEEEDGSPTDSAVTKLVVPNGLLTIVGHVAHLASPAAAGPSVAVVQDQKAQNTAGGTFTSGAWQTRTLQTEQSDIGGIVTVASNQFTPIAGTYLIDAVCPASLVNRHQARLRNVTAGTTPVLGTGVYAGTASDEAPSIIQGVFVANGTDAYEIQHQCQTTAATNGFGIPSNFGTEVYTTVTLTKIA